MQGLQIINANNMFAHISIVLCGGLLFFINKVGGRETWLELKETLMYVSIYIYFTFIYVYKPIS